MQTEPKYPVIAVLVRELLGLHGVLAAAGISMDDIFVTYARGAPLQVIVRQGEREFVIDVGDEPIDKFLTAEQFVAAWTEAVQAFNAAPLQMRKELVERTSVRHSAVELLALLAAKGFTVKREAN